MLIEVEVSKRELEREGAGEQKEGSTMGVRQRCVGPSGSKRCKESGGASHVIRKEQLRHSTEQKGEAY
eukprot:6153761-Pleurochrysis_carterae.AAC.1